MQSRETARRIVSQKAHVCCCMEYKPIPLGCAAVGRSKTCSTRVQAEYSSAAARAGARTASRRTQTAYYGQPMITSSNATLHLSPSQMTQHVSFDRSITVDTRTSTGCEQLRNATLPSPPRNGSGCGCTLCRLMQCTLLVVVVTAICSVSMLLGGVDANHNDTVATSSFLWLNWKRRLV